MLLIIYNTRWYAIIRRSAQQRCTDVHQWIFQWTPLVVFLQRITTQPRQIQGNSYRIASQTAAWISHSWIKIDNVSIKLAQSTKSLGVTIDNKLEHVNNVCKAAHCHVRALCHVKKYVSEDVAKSVATSLVSAGLDYCNALFYGTSGKNIDKLQRVQDTLARVVKECSKYDHIIPLLSQLFWLQFWGSRQYRQASRAIWLNWAQLTHQQGNLDPVHVGLISYMFQTSELH